MNFVLSCTGKILASNFALVIITASKLPAAAAAPGLVGTDRFRKMMQIAPPDAPKA